MATTNNKLKKDQVYPSDTFHTVTVFDTNAAIPSAATLKGSKVASLVNAINAKVQEQSSARREKSNPVIKRTSSVGRIAAHSTEVGIGIRINSSDCLLSNRSYSQTLPHSKYKVFNGFGSDCSDDDIDDVPTASTMMTRSLGRNEFLSIKAMHSPSRTFLREIPKGKVESNPFFLQDRQRTDVKQPRSSIKPMEDSNAFTSKCSAVSNSVSAHGAWCDSLNSRNESLSEPLSIKMRIQLWSEKERTAKQQQVNVERRKSAHFPVSSSPTKELDSILPSYDVCLSGSASANHGISTRQRSNSMSSLHLETQTEIHVDVPTIVSVSVASAGSIDTTGISSKVETQSPEGDVDNEAIKVDKKGTSQQSSPQTSPQVSPNGRNLRDSSLDAPKSNLHKLSSKLLSPRFRRKKYDSCSQECEEKNVKIASRSTRKRMAFKSKFHMTLSNPTYAEMHKPGASESISNIDDDVFTVEDDTSLQTSVDSKGFEMVITKNGAESFPVDPQKILHSIKSCKLTQTATIETGNLLNMKSTKANPEQEDGGADFIPMSCLHSECGRQQPEVKRTISGDIREIINSFGSASDSEMNMCRISGHYGSGESSSDGKLHVKYVGSCMFYKLLENSSSSYGMSIVL